MEVLAFMRIAICDDEQVFIDRISSCLASVAVKHQQKYEIKQCHRGDALIELAKKEKLDVVFLDISMPGINGFETADKLLKLQQNINIIFVSSNERMVFSSYDYKPFWFVPKSQLSMLEIVIHKLFNKIKNEEQKNIHIVINIEPNKVKEIKLDEAAYFRTDDHYVRIHNKDKRISDLYRNKLDNIESQLENQWFIRVHNRYLINCRMIALIEKNECVLINGERIPISRANMSKTKECFQNYLRSIR